MENYEIVTTIGKGSSGAVFLAKHLQTKRLVAIKRIEIDENRRSRCKKSVVREASILRRLNHPYIVECEEWFLDEKDEMINIVLEYCNGGTLQDLVRQVRIKKTYFPEEKVLKWMAEIVSAVAYMHSKKILHRDLKTENVFMVKPDIAKLGDFGISKEIDHTLDMAQTCVGTPCYLSPELCQDIPYSSKSDVWALGCLLFEMAALKPAFDAANLVSLFYKIVKGDFASLPEHCSKNIQDLISSILQKNPESRPSAAKLLGHPALSNLASQHITDSSPQKVLKKSSTEDTQNTAKRKKPPKLVELRDKSGNVEEFSSFETSETITNDIDRTLSPGPNYAYNMFLSGVKAQSGLELKEQSVSLDATNRSVSALSVENDKVSPKSTVPKLFAYQAQSHMMAGSPPPQEVETARPQTCPHSAAWTKTEHTEEENFNETVVTWSGYGNKDGCDSGRRFHHSISLSSDTDESSDDEYSKAQNRNKIFIQKRRKESIRSNGYSSDSSYGEVDGGLVPNDGDDDIPEMIEGYAEDHSGDSANTGDEQTAGDNSRVLPGSAWLKAKRAQVLKQRENNSSTGSNAIPNSNRKDARTRFPGSSWVSKEQQFHKDSHASSDVVLGEHNHSNSNPLQKRRESKRIITKSGNIRNLPGSAWLKGSPNRVESRITASPKEHVMNPMKKQPSMVLESYSSGSANESGNSDRRDSDSNTDAEYDSELSYPDDFDEYEDDFELSGSSLWKIPSFCL